MSEMTGIPYTDIIVAALLGSMCYFVMIFMTVHFEAKKLNLKGMHADELPTWKDILNDLHLLIPIFVLITLLVLRFSPTYSALIAIGVTFLSSWLRKHTRIGLTKAIEILRNAGKNTVLIATACVGANMMVLILTKTGITVSVGSLVTQIVGDSLFFAGLLIALMTLVLGMGIPTTPAYIIVAAVGAPTLINDFGIPMLAAHFFVFYFAILADATPPVSIAAYSAASISGADPIVTGFQASRLAIAGYIVGFSYLFVPELLMQGTFVDIFINISCILLGLTIFCIALTGFFVNKMRLSMRLILGPIGIFLALYNDITPEIRCGISLVALAFLYIVNTKFAKNKAVCVKQTIN
jgi:TRAP transporter 4TM/12TM fusion protein